MNDIDRQAEREAMAMKRMSAIKRPPSRSDSRQMVRGKIGADQRRGLHKLS